MKRKPIKGLEAAAEAAHDFIRRHAVFPFTECSYAQANFVIKRCRIELAKAVLRAHGKNCGK